MKTGVCYYGFGKIFYFEGNRGLIDAYRINKTINFLDKNYCLKKIKNPGINEEVIFSFYFNKVLQVYAAKWVMPINLLEEMEEK